MQRDIPFNKRTALFALFSAAIVLVHLPTVLALWDVSQADASASHVIIVPFISAMLIYQGRRAIFAVVHPAWLIGTVVALAGVTLSAAAFYWQDTGWSQARIGAVLLTWIGGFIGAYGVNAFRAARFPLVFLLFTIPIPAALLDVLTEALKVGSTEATAALFALIGVPHHREGFIFTLPNFAIEVADACSGIRSSIALVLTMLLVGHVTLETGWKRALLVAAVIPVTVFKNGVRIVSLTWLAMYVDPRFLSGRLHNDGGVVFFLLSLILLAPLVAVLRRSETRKEPTDYRLAGITS